MNFMKRTFLRGIAAAILVIAGCINSTAATTTLCPFGQFSKQPWQAKYFHQWYNNYDPEGWTAADFDDSAW